MLSCLTPQVQAQTFPQGRRINLGSTESPDVRQCFTFDEFKEISKYKLDCQACAEENAMYHEQMILYQQIIAEEDKIVAAHENSIATLKTENDRIHNMWIEENLARHRAEEKPSLQSWFPWAVSGVLGVATVFLTGWVIGR